MGDADRAFLEILPRVQRHALFQFRAVRDPHRREDLTQEVLAYCLKWARLLWGRGRDVRRFPAALAAYAVLSVRSGRRLCGRCKSKDALSEYAQARFGFACGRLPAWDAAGSAALQEALADNTRSPVGEQVAFRLDIPAWLGTLSARNRRIVGRLLLGESTKRVARRFGVSPGRVSQLRREFRAAWRRFTEEVQARA
jgi:DNA-directed RNA polymerase specialized sigma24 family protein